MQGFDEMIKNYTAEADRLFEYRRKLIEEIKRERDVDRLHNLEERKALIEVERYEILDDLKAILSYVKEDSDAEKKDIA